MARLYHYAKLSALDLGLFRSPGPGLGNLLFPVARALVGRESRGGEFVHPTFPQLKLGTYLRGDADKRTYGDVFRRRGAAEWRVWARARLARQVPEGDRRAVQGDCAVVYSGLGRYFHDLAGHRELVSAWLLANARLRGALAESFDIGVHVRRGDFVDRASLPQARHAVRLSASWYREAVDVARRLLGRPQASVRLFTDGDPRRIAAELAVPGIELDPGANAITSIVNLSRARVVVTSLSTFSEWAVFLGSGAAIWDAQVDLEETFPARPGLDHRL